ncbi:MAG: metal ABC transporter ATP-binding protein [Endomicrobia bacterium]|nr:metal ABC transporter ATP-binding protein [Endomicrobiia bacterium]
MTERNTAPALEIKNLSVRVRGRTILDSVNLSLEQGSFTVLTGPNGCGKSTLVKAICGLERYEGTIECFGKKIGRSDKRRIGYMPQNNVVDKNCPVSVFEAVSIGRTARNGIFKKLSDKDKKIINNALDICAITHIADMPAGKISGGEAQKVSLARILAQQPEIVLLDEPQTNLDAQSQQAFIDTISRLYRSFGFTCLMVTHNMDAVPECCGKVIKMQGCREAGMRGNN